MAIALDRDIRKTLESVVKKARIAAEKGARTALNEFGVADARQPSWLQPDQAALRNRLRAHARALGDPLNADQTMRLDRLAREIAYAHWHRALFARFLLENGLLVDVAADHAPVSAADLREIAAAEGRDAAEVAAEFAAPMLPEIFPKHDPVLALALPPETRQEIADLAASLPAQTFKADDSLGWTYQFWQADRKKQVNESGAKIGADELPAVTQLFTEDYMVLFLLENTLGAWWAGRKLAENPDLARDAADEDELRRRLSLPDYQWTYVRFVRDDEGLWRPAAGTFPGWPKTAREITLLDPCMGSGHFLVFALTILVALRQAEEGLDEEAAVMAVLSDNLHGLEIDPRCTQIAAFALALTAWKRIGRVTRLPTLHLACSGLAMGMGKAEFVKLAERIAEAEGFAGGRADLLGRERNPIEEAALARRRGGLERLYDLFAQAPVLGSLIDPRRALGDYGELFAEGFDGLAEVIGKVLAMVEGDDEARETAVTAQGLAKAAELLGRSYMLVASNVPYLVSGKMSQTMKEYTVRFYEEAKADLAACFVQRAFDLCDENGVSAMVTPHNWLFLGTYKRMRESITYNLYLKILVRLGSGAFETISGEIVNVAMLALVRSPKSGSHLQPFSSTCGGDGKLHAVAKINYFANDFGNVRGISEKKEALARRTMFFLSWNQNLLNRNAPFLTSPQTETGAPLQEVLKIYQGVSTGDGSRYVRRTWELPFFTEEWDYFQLAPFQSKPSDLSGLLRWEKGSGPLREIGTAKKGLDAKNSKGLAVAVTHNLFRTEFYGTRFDGTIAAMIPFDYNNYPAVRQFVLSDDFIDSVRKIDPSLSVTESSFGKVPFDLAHWRRVAAEKYPNGLPRPYSNDPTQWLFDGHPRGSADPNALDADGNPTRPGMAEHPLQVGVARLLGYRWPRQTGSSFMDCPAVAEPDEILRSGRASADGLVCLPALHGEAGAAERLRGVLQAAWGDAWAEGVVRDCLRAEEAKAEDLETWLAEEFFEGHCRLFHQTPFVWHVWDGVRGGFSALVNYHRLCAPDGEGRRLLEKLRDTYLGEWIARQRRLAAEGEALAEDRLAAAEHLRGELTKIIEGDPPYDIFVRWKPLSKQAIGWEPDIDDGVRLNIRPFLTARPRNAKAKKACILRTAPGVKKYEGADRGGEPHRDKTDYPWFWAEDHDVATLDFTGGAEFKGRRYNDFHYTRAFKLAARRAAKDPSSEAAE